MESWLKNTIPGIIVLGALGSLVAIIPVWIARTLPILHRRHMGKQAYVHGFSSACISKDNTGKMLTSALFYHSMLLTVFLSFFLFCVILLSVVLAFQHQTNLTASTLAFSSLAFVALYLGYCDFEFIYRTYLFFWKRAIAHANETYKQSSVNDRPEGKDQQA